MPIKRSFIKRTGVPVLIVFICWVLFHQIHFTNWDIKNDSLRLAVANISAILLFISIGFGCSFIYPYSHWRGAGLWERVVASFVTPAFWILKEAYRVSDFFTLPEVLYYMLNSLFLLLYIFFIGQCGLWEMIYRRRLKKGGATDIKIMSPIPVLSILLMFMGVFVIFIWGFGTHFFYIYIDGYKALFH